MTNLKYKSSQQENLFDWIKRAEEISKQACTCLHGSLDIDAALRAAVSQDIKHAKDEDGRELSRAQIVARMTDLTGDEITLSTLNNWTSASHSHNFPAKYLPSFVRATGGQRRVFEVLSRHAGLFALPGPEALRAEIQRFDEEILKLKNEKAKRRLFLREAGGE